MIGWQERLDRLFADRSDTKSSYREYDVRRIREKVRPPDSAALLKELTRRVSHGDLAVKYRVLSPDTRQGVLEFNSLLEIPLEATDPFTGQVFDVDVSNVEVVYASAKRAI